MSFHFKAVLSAGMLSALVTAGCKSIPLSHYVSPRIAGRVVDMETQQPIKGVKVRRITADSERRQMNPPKGGEVLQEEAPVLTGGDGCFVMRSTTSLTPFRQIGWFSVNLSFQHSRYEQFSATYTLAAATNTAKGEPLVNTGDVLLKKRR